MSPNQNFRRRHKIRYLKMLLSQSTCLNSSNAHTCQAWSIVQRTGFVRTRTSSCNGWPHVGQHWPVSRQELDNVGTTVVARLCRCQLSVTDAVKLNVGLTCRGDWVDHAAAARSAVRHKCAAIRRNLAGESKLLIAP